MKRSPFVLLAALALPASALAQTDASSTSTPTTAVTASAPERVIKFVDLKFADPTSWQCQQPQQVQMQQAADGSTVSALLTATDFRCLDCSSTSSGSSSTSTSAGGSNQMTISRAPDGTPETVSVPEGSRVRICSDLVTIGSPAASVAPAGSSTSSSGSAAE